jgi:hypothetical protein
MDNRNGAADLRVLQGVRALYIAAIAANQLCPYRTALTAMLDDK